MARCFIGGVEYVRCVYCGELFPKDECQPADNIPGVAHDGRRYVCPVHKNNYSYSTKNTNVVHKAAKHGFRFGLELECVPFSENARAVLCSAHYGLIPTRDGSLPWGGVEFKTGIIENGSAVKSAMFSWVKFADFTHPKCGQHINFSRDDWPSWKYLYLQDNAIAIFQQLAEHMIEDETKTEKVCGRYFTHYAGNYRDYFQHENWLNLSHRGRLEWRLAKMQSPQQYFWLICMCKEMCEQLDTHLFQYVGTDKEEHAKEKTAKKLVDLFDKYAAGNAKCQSEKRNKKA